jgi:predicted SprT family Zn-dependent metalloprotease
VIKKRIWPILIHEIRVADYPQRAEKKHARRIKKKNEKFHLRLKILGMRWLEKVKGIKNYVSLIVKIPCAE